MCGQWARAAEPARFDILEFAVEGNTVLPAELIERAVYPFLGEKRRFDDVNAAATALEKAYQDAGYLTVAVGVPEQSINDGVVRLEVTEGRVERLKVSGAQYTLPSRVREQLPSLAEGEVPSFPEVQEELGQLGRNADLKVTPLLQPGRVPGSVNVELKLDDASPLHGSLEWNNKRSADTDTGRVEATLRYDNLWQRRHSIGLTYFAVPSAREQIEVWGINYSAPVGKGFLAGFFARSNSNIPTQFDTSSLGRGDTAGLRWILPLPDRGMAMSHNLSLGVDWKNNEQDTLGIGGTAFRFSQPVKYWVLNGQYGIHLPFESGARLRLGASLNVGTSAMNERLIDCGGVRVEQFSCRRDGAKPGFFVSRFEAEGAYPLGEGWSLSGRLDVQRSGDPLINSEQFSAGGFDSVRGYLESERLGDEGERVRLELATPSLGLFDALGVRGLLFYDWAGLYIREAFAGQQTRAALEGVGLGVRMEASQGLKLNADWAYAMRDGQVGRTQKGDQRVLVSLSYGF